VLAGGVEGSKFCLFSVIMPANCVSSISPRFHYRRLAFCFLPLAAILESLHTCFFSSFFLVWNWGLNLRVLHTCKAGAPPLEPHLQLMLLSCFWRWDLQVGLEL
jgi:hypothetical protein